MNFVEHLGLFLCQAVIIVSSLIIVLAFLFSALNRAQQKPQLDVESLNEKYDGLIDAMKSHLLPKKEFKAYKKKQKKKKPDELKKNLFVVQFTGDIKASQVEDLKEEINAILLVAGQDDEVLVRLESPGGMVHGYGLAASQLKRVKDKGLRLTVAVDKVAASGGYLMACVANEILAAPFAIVGSIGVVAQVPNLNRVLKRLDVDYHEYTAGEYKRTVSLLGEITPKKEEKFVQQLEETHTLFKNFVVHQRPEIPIEKVATGEYWYGEQATGLGLVDRIMTSDEFMLKKRSDFQIFSVTHHHKKGFSDKITEMFQAVTENILERLRFLQ